MMPNRLIQKKRKGSTTYNFLKKRNEMDCFILKHLVKRLGQFLNPGTFEEDGQFAFPGFVWGD